MADLRRSFAVLDEVSTPDLKRDIENKDGPGMMSEAAPSNRRRIGAALVALAVAAAGVLFAIRAFGDGPTSPVSSTTPSTQPTPSATPSIPAIAPVPAVTVEQSITLHLGQITAAQEGFGSLWVALITNDGKQRLLRVDPATGSTQQSYALSEISAGEWGGKGIAIGAGSVWVAGADTGFNHAVLFRIDPAGNTVHEIRIEGRGVEDVAFDSGTLWALVAQQTQGSADVVELDPATEQILSTTRFQADWYGGIFPAQGTAWVVERGVKNDTVQGGGLVQIVPGNAPPLTTGGSFAEPVTDGTSIWAPFYGDSQAMNLAHGIARIDPISGQVIGEWKTDPIGFDMAIGQDGGIWFLGGKGLERFNPSTGETDVDLSVGGTPIFIQSTNGGIWVGTYEGDLIRFDVRSAS
jgi:hypothetical protein